MSCIACQTDWCLLQVDLSRRFVWCAAELCLDEKVSFNVRSVLLQYAKRKGHPSRASEKELMIAKHCN